MFSKPASSVIARLTRPPVSLSPSSRLFRPSASAAIPILHTRLLSRSSDPKMSVVRVKSSSNLTEALQSGRPTIVDFTATWCGPCKSIKPHFEKFASDENFQHINFLTIDVDDFPEIAREYGIMAMPTFVFFKSNGEKDKVVQGANPIALKTMLLDVPGAGSENIPA